MSTSVVVPMTILSARVVLQRSFPRMRSIDDDAVRGAGDVPRVKLRDGGAQGITVEPVM